MARQIPQVLDLELEQGSTWDDTCINPLTIYADEDHTELFDLTDWLARSMVRKKYSDTTPKGTFTCSIDLETSTITFSMDADDTAAIPAGTYYYDVEIYTEAGVVRRVRQGTIIVSAEVTK